MKHPFHKNPIPCRLCPCPNPNVIFVLTKNNIITKLLSNKWHKILLKSDLKMCFKVQNSKIFQSGEGVSPSPQQTWPLSQFVLFIR